MGEMGERDKGVRRIRGGVGSKGERRSKGSDGERWR